MSKVVTIPTCMNPYVVIVNNREYSYTAGETVEVPDEVAEVIEGHIEAQHTVPQTSAPVTPRVGGDATKEWQKLIDMELTEAINAVTANEDVNGNPFEVTELFFRVYMPAVTDGGATYFKVGTGTKGLRYYFSQGLVAYMGGHIMVADGSLHHVDGLVSTTNEFSYKLNPPYGDYYDGVALGVNKVTSVTAGLFNAALKMPVGTKIKVYGR